MYILLNNFDNPTVDGTMIYDTTRQITRVLMGGVLEGTNPSFDSVNVSGTITGNSGSPPTILHLDDAQYSTTSTALTVMKTFRFVQSTQYPITSLTAYISAWNASSSATTTIAVNVDGGANSTVTTSATTETLLNIADLAVPTTEGIHTLNLLISTSNASYAAYTQLLEVYTNGQ